MNAQNAKVPREESKIILNTKKKRIQKYTKNSKTERNNEKSK